jgi:hypothetical protein
MTTSITSMAKQPHVFTYWEGEEFSYLHYLTIKSLHKYNPDLNITIYTAKYKSNILQTWDSGEHSVKIIHKMDFRDVLRINPDKITIKEIDFNAGYGLNNDISCVFKADFTRIAKLYEHGGLWFDMDVLFIKPIPSYMFDFTDSKEICYFTYLDAIPTGLISCKPYSSFITILYEYMISIIDTINTDKTLVYQTLGPELWLNLYASNYYQIHHTMTCIETTDVYPVLYTHLQIIYTNNGHNFPTNTWAIHWYNGHSMSKDFINNMRPDSLGDSLIERYIKEII